LAVSTYLDASVLVALFTPDPFSPRADALLRSADAAPLVSDFAAAELASVVARRVRTREFNPEDARTVFSNFDTWAAQLGSRVPTEASDIIVTEGLLRRLDLPLRTPDALHIAIAQRVRATLATFDQKLAKSATAVGIPVSPQIVPDLLDEVDRGPFAP
jgi:predicted nucleic acid-binding protein